MGMPVVECLGDLQQWMDVVQVSCDYLVSNLPLETISNRLHDFMVFDGVGDAQSVSKSFSDEFWRITGFECKYWFDIPKKFISACTSFPLDDPPMEQELLEFVTRGF